MRKKNEIVVFGDIESIIPTDLVANDRAEFDRLVAASKLLNGGNGGGGTLENVLSQVLSQVNEADRHKLETLIEKAKELGVDDTHAK